MSEEGLVTSLNGVEGRFRWKSTVAIYEKESQEKESLCNKCTIDRFGLYEYTSIGTRVDG